MTATPSPTPLAATQLTAASESSSIAAQGAAPRSDPHLFERVFNLPKPSCCSHGDCCKGASPSTPVRDLWPKAAAGDEFARNFLSIFEPYPSHDAARAVVPGLVDRTLAAAAKHPHFNGDTDAVVFYRCRYLQADNRCGVYEDRPQFCRDYPDTPFVVMAPGCAFEAWGQACRSQYHALQDQTDTLRQLRDALSREAQAAQHSAALSLEPAAQPSGVVASTVLPQAQALLSPEEQAHLRIQNLPWVLALTSLYVASPMLSWWLDPQTQEMHCSGWCGD